MRKKNWDRFAAEREKKEIEVTIYGRKITVPAELPWYYVMKVQATLNGDSEGITPDENRQLVKDMLKPDDYEFITNHPDFKAATFFDFIAFVWLNNDDEDEEESKEPKFETEDDVKVAETQNAKPKNAGSAR